MVLADPEDRHNGNYVYYARRGVGSFAQPRDHLADPLAQHLGQVLALGRAGSVLVFNGITWHGGTTNRTSRPRRAIHSFWLARQIEQQTDQAHWISPAAIAELSPAPRYLVHV